VDPTILAEIFDPFFTTKAAGTGLGLAIVRKIVDQHGGRVVVDTRKGEGTRVRVILPRRQAS
jgi:signal transduction histidine kinase